MMGLAEMIRQRLAANMAVRMRERAEAAASTSASLPPQSTNKEGSTSEAAPRESDRAEGEKAQSARNSGILRKEPGNQKKPLADRTLLLDPLSPPKSTIKDLFKDEVQGQNTSRLLRGEKLSIRDYVPVKKSQEPLNRLQVSEKAPDTKSQVIEKYRPNVVRPQFQDEQPGIQKPLVRQPLTQEPTVQQPQEMQLGHMYASLKPATKRKRIDEDPTQPPLRRKYTYNAKGTRILSDRNEVRDNHTTKKSNSFALGIKYQPKLEEGARNMRLSTRGSAPRTKKEVECISREIVDVRAGISSKLADLSCIYNIIQQCIAVSYSGDQASDIGNLLSKLRAEIQKASLTTFPDQAHVIQSKVLEQDALPKVFNGLSCRLFPLDMRSDAEALWLRLRNGESDGFIMRGILVRKSLLSNGKHHTSRSLDKSYNKKRSPCVIGANGLLNGQWWESRLCAIRDGAHGVIEGGIYGSTEKGALSIVIGSGSYEDEDDGETVKYCGTASGTQIPTMRTKYLNETLAKDQPVRVLRAVNGKSKFAPPYGIRYDGLYKITSKEVLDPNIAMFRYTLTRIDGQEPIRYKGVSKKPNPFEIVEVMKIKKLMSSA